MSDILIRAATEEDQDWINRQVIKDWGAQIVVAQGKVYYPAKLNAFVAYDDQNNLGLLTYESKESEIEIITLNSFAEDIGVGTALINTLIKLAKDSKIKQIKVITTNDNLKALALYQKRGFALNAVYPGAVDLSRKHKNIPNIAENGIPIRDEIELICMVDHYIHTFDRT
ncbi:MAG: GNAT family N-acetyltransferase [Proteobacteria bacterium]|nr:GNAT family N-acetyltransferase [Pseudomonadota bacterium]